MTAYEGKLYVFGGHDRHGEDADSHSAEVFDGVSWSVFSCPLPSRKGMGAAVFNGNLYVIGGQSGTRFSAEVACFDGAVWSRAPPMSCPRSVFGIATF